MFQEFRRTSIQSTILRSELHEVFLTETAGGVIRSPYPTERITRKHTGVNMAVTVVPRLGGVVY